MSSGNGVDLGHVVAMLSDLLAGQEALRVEHGRKLDDQARKLDDQARQLDGQARQLGDLASSVSTLRQAVTEYHSTVLGHGILITELDERLRRVERHLDLPPPRAAE